MPIILTIVLYHRLQNDDNIVASINKMTLSGAISLIISNISFLRHNFDIRFTDSLSQYVIRV